jgi:hypothetical protein
VVGACYVNKYITYNFVAQEISLILRTKGFKKKKQTLNNREIQKNILILASLLETLYHTVDVI